MSTNLDKIMWLNRRVPVGTHGGVRGRLFRVERASYSIIYNHPSTFPIVCMWDKPAFSFLIKTVLISLQSNPEKNSHRLLVANLWLVKHPFFVSAILGISLYSKNPFIYRTCFGGAVVRGDDVGHIHPITVVAHHLVRIKRNRGIGIGEDISQIGEIA